MGCGAGPQREPCAARGCERNHIVRGGCAVPLSEIELGDTPPHGGALGGGSVRGFQRLRQAGVSRTGSGIAIAVQELGVGAHGLRIGRSRIGGPFQARLRFRGLAPDFQRPCILGRIRRNSLGPPVMGHSDQPSEKEREPHRSSYLPVAGHLTSGAVPQCSIPALAAQAQGPGALVRTSHNPPDDVAHAPARPMSRLFPALRRAVTQRSESERRQEWRRGTQSACATSSSKRSGEKCGLLAARYRRDRNCYGA